MRSTTGSATKPCRFCFRYASLAPRIHRRLAQDIRHRYRRYRPGDRHRPGGRCGTGYGGHAEFVFGSLTNYCSNFINGSRRVKT